MEIIKKKVNVEHLEVINGEPTVNREEKTIYFVMDLMAQKLFEIKYGKPLMSTLMNNKSNEQISNMALDTKFKVALFSACYFEVEDTVKHNEVTQQTFCESELINLCDDFELLNDLLQLVVAYFNGKSTTQNKANKGGNSSQKK